MGRRHGGRRSLAFIVSERCHPMLVNCRCSVSTIRTAEPLKPCRCPASKARRYSQTMRKSFHRFHWCQSLAKLPVRSLPATRAWIIGFPPAASRHAAMWDATPRSAAAAPTQAQHLHLHSSRPSLQQLSPQRSCRAPPCCSPACHCSPLPLSHAVPQLKQELCTMHILPVLHHARLAHSAQRPRTLSASTCQGQAHPLSLPVAPALHLPSTAQLPTRLWPMMQQCTRLP